MKLKYDFDMMDLDDGFVAVPVGEGAQHYHGVIRLNKSAAKIFSYLNEDVSENYILEKLYEEYEMDPKEDIREYVHSFLLKLSENGVLDLK